MTRRLVMLSFHTSVVCNFGLRKNILRVALTMRLILHGLSERAHPNSQQVSNRLTNTILSARLKSVHAYNHCMPHNQQVSHSKSTPPACIFMVSGFVEGATSNTSLKIPVRELDSLSINSLVTYEVLCCCHSIRSSFVLFGLEERVCESPYKYDSLCTA